MAITLEQVEKIKEKADVSYEEAKAALDRNHGDLLDALIDLERRGKSDTAKMGGFYSTQPAAQTTPCAALAATPQHGGKSTRGGNERFGEVWHAFQDLLSRALSNQLEIWKSGRMLTSVPALVLILLTVFFFCITFPLLLTGFFFGCRYRFRGPDMGWETVNRVMDNMSDTMEDIKEIVKHKLFDKPCK